MGTTFKTNSYSSEEEAVTKLEEVLQKMYDRGEARRSARRMEEYSPDKGNVVYPWDCLSKEDYDKFMMMVGNACEREVHKGKGLERSRHEIMLELWDRWNGY